MIPLETHLAQTGWETLDPKWLPFRGPVARKVKNVCSQVQKGVSDLRMPTIHYFYRERKEGVAESVDALHQAVQQHLDELGSTLKHRLVLRDLKSHLVAAIVLHSGIKNQDR